MKLLRFKDPIVSKEYQEYQKWLEKKTNKPSAKELKEIKILEKRALSLWKLVVKEKAGRRCEICGKTKKLQSHHIESYSTNKGLRYNSLNGACLCMTCHKFGRFSAHRSFVTMYIFMNDSRSLSLTYLIQNYTNKIEITKDFLLQTISNLTKELEGIK